MPGDLAEQWVHKRVQDIAKRDILDLSDDIVDRGGGQSANRTLATVRKFFSWCVERHIIGHSPCTGVKDPVAKVSRNRVLTDDEIRWLWQAATECAFPFGTLAKALLLTGQRRDECAAMCDPEIDPDAKRWTILGARAKNGKPHDVPLSDAMLAVLDSPRVKSKVGFLFTTNGRTHITGYSKAKREIDAAMLAATRAERGPDFLIPNWRFHDLRRTVAIGMARLGIALPVIEKVLNHTSGSFSGIVSVYQRHHYLDEKRHALETWARHIETLTGERASNVVAIASQATADQRTA